MIEELKESILIADDVSLIREIVKKHFKEHFHVLEAVNGKEALEIMRNQRVDILITDIFMPVMDGVELIKAIREDESIADTTIIAITDRGDEHEVQVLLAGADDFVNKPLCMDIFEHRIKNLVSQKQLKKLTDHLPSGIGIYHVYADGKVQQVYLNDGYFDMIGKKRDDRSPYLGYSALRAVHTEDREKLHDTLMKIVSEDQELDINMRVMISDTDYKWLNVKGNIVFKSPEMCTVNVVYSDIDEIKRLQIQLENTQAAVEFAKKRGDIALWSYDIDKRVISQDFMVKGSLGYPLVIENVPVYFLKNGDVHPDDVDDFMKAYEELENGKEQCEATFRLMNHEEHHYDWIHMFYQRVESKAGKNRVAIGFFIKVNLQQEHLRQYRAEQQVRRRLVHNSIFYYQVNLTKYQIEEYRSLENMEERSTPFAINEELRDEIRNAVEPKYRQAVEDTLFTKALWKKFRNGEASTEIEYRRKINNEDYHWVWGTAMIMNKPDSREVAAFIYIQDIDREKKEQLAIASVLDEEIESVILLNIKDMTVDIVLENHPWKGKKLKERFQLDQELIDLLMADISEEDRERCRKFISLENVVEGLEKENLLKITYKTVDESGNSCRKKMRAMYLDEYHEEIVYARRDITDLYEEEEKQKRTLKNAITEANAANQAKSEFLSRMSHDMRTPLNAIIGLSGAELVEGTDEEQKREFLDKIHASGEYLLGIINDILDMSKIESQKMVLNPEPYSIKEFRTTIETVIGEQCRQKGVTFVQDTHAITRETVLLDKVRFNQIFVNLLSNAVKFTPTGGKVELIMECIEDMGTKSKKRFTVRDNGIGMSKEFLPHAFDNFSQEDNKNITKNTQGTGLGLSIVKELVGLMGGTIRVESELGKGTTFILEMELTVVDEASAVPIAQKNKKEDVAGVLSGKKVLLCEDHPLNIQIAKMLLEKKNCIVTVAENGKIALDRFKASEQCFFDVVLMDIRMPVMDGLTATEKIRKLDREDAKTVPIIAMTANAFDEDVQISLNAGMTDHLAKPIDPKLFYSTIEKYVNK